MRPKGSAKELEERRFRAIALLEKGLGVTEVARRVGCTQPSVSRWKKKLEEEGKEALVAKPHPGKRSRLSKEQKQHLLEILVKGARAAGFRTESWTCSRVAQVIERTFGIHYHPCHVWRILKGLGWSCQKPERQARERDEKAISRWRKRTWPQLKKS